MLKRLTTLILLLAFSSLFAQITITSSDILSLIGQTHTIEANTDESTPVNVGNAGANQTWDFSSIPVDGEYSLVYLNPEGTTFGGDYPEANFLVYNDFSSGDSLTYSYNYMKVTPDQLTTEALILEISLPGEETEIFNVVDNDTVPLPLIYGAQWQSEHEELEDLGEGSFFLTKSKSQSIVDAWGTVILPSGSYDALRIREDLTDEYSYLINDVVVYSDTVSAIYYQWVSKTALLLASIESLDDETDPNFTEAQFFERLKSTTTAIDEPENRLIVNGYQLYQNYPNPFNPTTNISFDLARAGMVELTVYDSNGRHVATLLNGYQNAGRYTLPWDASGLASGVYYYQLRGADFKLVKKGLLMK